STTGGGGGGSGAVGTGFAVLVTSEKLPQIFGTANEYVYPPLFTLTCQASNGWRPAHRTFCRSAGLPARLSAIHSMRVPGAIVVSAGVPAVSASSTCGAISPMPAIVRTVVM